MSNERKAEMEFSDYSTPYLEVPKKLPSHPDNLLPAPFRALFIGCSGSGKTYSIIGMIQKFYSGFFDRIHIFSPSAGQSATNPWSLLGLPSERICETYDEAEIKKIVEHQKESEITQGKLPKTLLIFDDCAGILQGKQNSYIARYIMHARHDNVSILMTTQKCCAIPTSIRCNVDHVICFKISNQKELDTILKENGDAENIRELYEYAVSPVEGQPPSFFHINKRSNRFFKNWNVELNITVEPNQVV